MFFMKQDRYSNSILLSGSYARGKHTEYSDIDFILISDSVNFFYTESIYLDDVETQVILFPKTKIHKYIMEESNENNGIVVSMLKSCIILSDESNFANRLTSYVDRIQSPPGEQKAISYINMLRNRCADLRHAEDGLAKDILVSTIIVLLSHILANNYIVGTKHCIRILKKSPHFLSLENLIEQYHTDRKTDTIVDYCDNLLKGYFQNVVTTGLSLNNLLDKDPVIIYLPKKQINDNGIKRIIKTLSKATEGCSAYAFRQDKWQAMNEGLYFYVRSTKTNSIDILKVIKKYDASISRSRLALGIEMAYPYFTSFSSGVFFGGRKVLEMLESSFSKIWDAWYSFYIVEENNNLNKLSYFSGVLVVNCLGKHFSACLGNYSSFFEELAWLLLPDVVNPNGLCNVEQTEHLKRSALKEYTRQFEKYIEVNGNVINDVILGNYSELSKMNNAIIDLDNVLYSIDTQELIYPDIFPFKTKEEFFYTECCLHTLSILQLSNETKMSIVFNLARNNGICLEDFQ